MIPGSHSGFLGSVFSASAIGWKLLGSRDRETAIESRGKWGEKTPLQLDESSDSQQGTQETRPRTS